MRTTSSLRPRASVAPSSVRAMASSVSRVRVVGAGGSLADDAARRDEAGDVVDVAVGVVVLQALVDPDDLLGAERVAKRGFGLLLASSRCGWD